MLTFFNLHFRKSRNPAVFRPPGTLVQDLTEISPTIAVITELTDFGDERSTPNVWTYSVEDPLADTRLGRIGSCVSRVGTTVVAAAGRVYFGRGLPEPTQWVAFKPARRLWRFKSSKRPCRRSTFGGDDRFDADRLH